MDPEVVIIQKDKFLFAVNNNPESNGGYTFKDYTWYIIPNTGTGIAQLAEGVSDQQTYTPNLDKRTNLDFGADYQVKVVSITGRVMRTSSFQVKHEQMHNVEFNVYPNPVEVNAEITVECNLDPEEYANAVIDVYSTLGVRIHSIKVQDQKTIFRISERGSFYINFKSKVLDGTKTIIVK